MFNKIIEYSDFDGNPVSNEFQFNMDKAEITEFGFSHGGDVQTYFKQVMKTEDTGALIGLFKDLLTRSVGRRSEDGRRFVKNQDIIDDFMQTGAYSAFFMDLVTHPETVSPFIVGIAPSDMREGLTEQLAKVEAGGDVSVDKVYTTQELIAMDQHEFDSIVGTDPLKMSQEHLMAAFNRKGLAKA